MQKRVLTLLAVSLLGLALVSGCGSSEKKEASTPQNKVIKIGATAGPHADVVHAVADEAKKQGINVEVIEFSDYITPDKALAEGDLDLNSYQHAPFWQILPSRTMPSSFLLAIPFSCVWASIPTRFMISMPFLTAASWPSPMTQQTAGVASSFLKKQVSSS